MFSNEPHLMFVGDKIHIVSLSLSYSFILFPKTVCLTDPFVVCYYIIGYQLFGRSSFLSAVIFPVICVRKEKIITLFEYSLSLRAGFHSFFSCLPNFTFSSPNPQTVACIVNEFFQLMCGDWRRLFNIHVVKLFRSNGGWQLLL